MIDNSMAPDSLIAGKRRQMEVSGDEGRWIW